MNRRLLFAIIFVLLFAVGVIIWFFYYTTPKGAPSLGEPTNPLSLSTLPKRFQFIFQDTTEEETTSTTEVTFQEPQALTEIWNKPATGQTFVEMAVIREADATSTQGTTTISIKKLVRATSTILMFVDRMTGHIYGYNRELGKVYQISNTTIPGIYDAYIFNNGKRIVLRHTDNDKQAIVGILADIPDVDENDQAEPLENITYLPSQVTSIAVNKKGTLLSYLVTGDQGGSIYTITNKETALITTTPFKEWKLSYGGDTLFATSKPSAYVEGQTVLIPSFEFIVGQKTGLMSNPSPTGLFLNSMWSSKGLKTFLSSGGNLVVLNTTTLASKCAWGQKDFLICAIPKTLPRGTEGLPDDWFQGRVTFDDSFITIDTTTSTTYPLYIFETPENKVFDVTSITVSNNNNFIGFNRKQDATLWLLDINRISVH